MSDRLGAHRAVVTGAAAGQGRAIANALAAEGCALILLDQDPSVRDLAAEIAEKRGVVVSAIVDDVAEPSTWERVSKELDRIAASRTILINNAGVYRRGEVDELPIADADLLYRVNQRAVLVSTAALLPLLREGRGGAVVNISSTAGITGEPFISAYSGTKWAVRGITRSLAAELGPLGIRVNAIVPGLIDTAMAAANGAEVNEAIVARTFVGRIGRPDEVAAAVLLLVGEEASYITGAEIVIDGGLSV